MEEREDNENSESSDDSVEIPIGVEGEADGDEEAGDLDEKTSEVEASDGGEFDDETAEPAADGEDLDDLYVSPDERDVEVVDPGDEEPGEAGSDAEAGEPEAEEAEPEGPSREALLERVDELEQQVEELEDERDEYENRMLRAAADLENFRKRAERDKKELRKYGAKDLVKDLLQNVDNLERALEHADASDASNIIEGVEMVLRQIHTTLEKHGIERFESEGEEFDPEKHEAIQQVETTDQESGTIVEEFQKGYTIYDRLLRPAMVIVAENVTDGEGDEATEGDAEAAGQPDEQRVDEPQADDSATPVELAEHEAAEREEPSDEVDESEAEAGGGGTTEEDDERPPEPE